MPLTDAGSAGFRPWPPETGRRGLLASTLVLAVAVAACGAEPQRNQQPSAPPAPTEGVTVVEKLVLPFDAYKATPKQQATLGNAHNRLVVACMRKHDITVTPPTEDPKTLAAIDPGNSRRYGVTDIEAARTHGYHLARPASPDTTEAWAANLPEQTRDRLYGTSADRGCLDQASLSLEKGARKADWPWLAKQDSASLEQSAKNPEVVAAVKRWRECMSKAGHDYVSPEMAIGDSRWTLDKPEVGAPEKRAATDDTTCKWSSGLVLTWYAADSELQQKVIDENPSRFAAFRANLKHRLQRASAVLAADEGREVR
ncbi:hypothetical protein SAMN05421874_110193 [Nonomuraea maritima]|uniref:Uncharacterized protein n=1 Tax=Nonomuraea maritima TaxID=683260 RepID=A0A1G9EA54_9ACTN|nr:hypothetical protein [Nonomuraea maritima]SDK72926.1 hypothetical protein SAMN05421874_110193 [Nonomuraea maritima]